MLYIHNSKTASCARAPLTCWIASPTVERPHAPSSTWARGAVDRPHTLALPPADGLDIERPPRSTIPGSGAHYLLSPDVSNCWAEGGCHALPAWPLESYCQKKARRFPGRLKKSTNLDSRVHLRHHPRPDLSAASLARAKNEFTGAGFISGNARSSEKLQRNPKIKTAGWHPKFHSSWGEVATYQRPSHSQTPELSPHHSWIVVAAGHPAFLWTYLV